MTCAISPSALFRIINVKSGANSKVFNIEMLRFCFACFYFAGAMGLKTSIERKHNTRHYAEKRQYAD